MRYKFITNPKNAIQVKYEPFRGIYELGMLCKYIPLYI